MRMDGWCGGEEGGGGGSTYKEGTLSLGKFMALLNSRQMRSECLVLCKAKKKRGGGV